MSAQIVRTDQIDPFDTYRLTAEVSTWADSQFKDFLLAMTDLIRTGTDFVLITTEN